MLVIQQKSCMDNIKITMAKYCIFKGRARRSEFWFFKLSLFIINFIYLSLAKIILVLIYDDDEKEEDESNDINDNVPALVIYLIIDLIFFMPNISVSVRRLHDVGKSGFYYFLNLIPIIGTIILIYYYLKDSEPDSNEYGVSVKYIPQTNDFSRRDPLVNNITNEMQEFP